VRSALGVVVAENDRAVATLGSADALAQLREVVVDIYDLSLGRASRPLVVTTGIEGDPAATELIHASNLLP
jgi:hypothetical protein